MKKFQTLFAAAVCGAMVTVAVSASAQATQNGTATVTRVSGVAEYSLGDGQWHPLLANRTLAPGSVIRTGNYGEVDVVLGRSVPMPQVRNLPARLSSAPDAPVRGLIGYQPTAEQNVVRLTPHTVLSIDKLTVSDTGADAVSDTELSLKQGKIYASVRKLSGASQYLIRLPNGIAGVRGTMFSLSADGTTEVLDSRSGGVVLSMTGADGTAKTFLVGPGQSFSPLTGQVSALTSEAMGYLSRTFDYLKTTFMAPILFSIDRTGTYVSPTQGR